MPGGRKGRNSTKITNRRGRIQVVANGMGSEKERRPVRFQYSWETGLTECDEYSGFFHVDVQREGVILGILDKDRNLALSFVCEQDFRKVDPQNPAEAKFACPNVILWKINWRPIFRRECLSSSTLTKSVVESFFQFWQLGLGSGCYIDGKAYDAPVEVRFLG